MEEISKLRLEVEKIKRRNAHVETDKAWEASWARRSLLALFTYIAIAIYLQIIQIPDPWLNAVVPSVGFMLSTLTLSFFKQQWIKYMYKRK
ncbi:hypothetical protein HYW55_05235 [Candidatus Gottesmanbacteria bacterium]|nr:hypothetical protein [Candidatus Gottesmanbacteria bacterium]